MVTSQRVKTRRVTRHQTVTIATAAVGLRGITEPNTIQATQIKTGASSQHSQPASLVEKKTDKFSHRPCSHYAL